MEHTSLTVEVRRAKIAGFAWDSAFHVKAQVAHGAILTRGTWVHRLLNETSCFHWMCCSAQEIVQAAMKALDDCASVMLSADLYINERQGERCDSSLSICLIYWMLSLHLEAAWF